MYCVEKPAMPFGKYRGRPIEEVPHGYLNWVLDNCGNISDGLRSQIQAALNGEEVIPMTYRKLSDDELVDRAFQRFMERYRESDSD